MYEWFTAASGTTHYTRLHWALHTARLVAKLRAAGLRWGARTYRNSSTWVDSRSARREK
jgi:hypothetical protein